MPGGGALPPVFLLYRHVIGIFYAVGLFMFLLPPVPGVPVYFAGGIIVVKKAELEYGFYPAMLICIGVCFSIKVWRMRARVC